MITNSYLLRAVEKNMRGTMELQKHAFRKLISLIFLVSVGLVYVSIVDHNNDLHRRVQKFIERDLTAYDGARMTDSASSGMSMRDGSNLSKVVTLQLYPVASRYPATPEYSSLEDAVFFHLNSELSSQRIETVSVEAQREKSELHVIQLDSLIGGTDNREVETSQGMRPPDWSQPSGSDSSDQVGRLIVSFLIKGRYIPPPYIDYESLLKDALDNGNINIIKHLLSGRASHYFRRLSKVEFVEVADAPDVGGDDEVVDKNFVSAKEDYEDYSEDIPVDEAIETDTAVPMDTPDEGEQDNNISTPQENTTPDKKQRPNLNRDDSTTYTLPKNSGAMYSRFVTSCILLAMCSVIAIWNIVRLATKRYKARKRRIALAKEAFRAPYALSGGKTVQSGDYDTSFKISMNRNFAGAMDKDKSAVAPH